MGYIIGFNDEQTKALLYIARHFIDRFTCRDYTAAASVVYGGRVVCFNALIFETVDRAKQYAQHNINGSYKVFEYDSCMNCVKKEVAQ